MRNNSLIVLAKILAPITACITIYLTPILAKMPIIVIVGLLAYYVADYAERKALNLYIALLVLAYILMSLASHLAFTELFNGFLNILGISLALTLMILVVEPFELDLLASKLGILSSKYYNVIRTTLLSFKILLREVEEARLAIKAKMTSKNLLDSLRYSARILFTTIMLAEKRSFDVAEALLYNPLPRNVCRRRRH